MPDGVAIVGAAESDLGVTGQTILGLQAQGVTRALADAGLTLADVDGLATTGVSRFSTAQVAEYLGIQPTWAEATMAGGASFEIFLGHAAEAIRAGRCEVVVISYGSNQRSARSRSLGGVSETHLPDQQFEAPYGPLYPISLYAMAAQRYLHEYAATPEQLAEVAVAARAWALLNPKAFRHDAGPLSVEDVLASPLVSSPLRVADCCLVTDGGGAIVVTSLERARDLAQPTVVVRGWGECTTSSSMAQVPDLLVPGAAVSGRRALADAGLTVTDIDVLQVYDSFTINVLLSLEALGVCGPGEAARLVEDGRIAPGGSLALNTSGGGLSYCHPGMLGLLLIIEAVAQLRGQACARQVPGARTALVHATGGILSTHATVVLEAGR
ncbi:MAG TPA: acetyl-CoA acetyltransferase [Streptosporangiaceae bacterium]|nr:acetyl-CoA acetyltransferase [Streptosporangiaceae bacterium]